MKRKGKGFTIVELVIVIAVIAILAAVLVPTFSEIIRKAQTNSDIQLVSRLNELLSVDEDINGAKRPTMHDAVVVLEGEGYKVENLTPTNKAENNIVYDLDAGRFQLLGKDNKIILTDEKTLESSKALKDGTFDPNCAYRLFKMYDSIADFEKDVVVEGEENKDIKFSIYASPNWTEENVLDITVGFDAGRATTVKSVSYVRTESDDGQDVVIRTNSANTTLSIYAPNDEVKHYDFCGKVFVKAAKDASYHEFGDVAFMEINKGHVVVETDASVDLMYSNPQAYKVENNEIVLDTIATVPAVTVSNNGEIDHAHASSEASATATTNASQNVTFDYDGVNLSKDDTNHTTVNHAYGTYANDGVNSWTIETAAEQAVIEMKTKEAAKNTPVPTDPEIEYVAVNVTKVASLGAGAYYTSLKAAYDAAVDNDTIALLTDITLWDKTGGFTAMWDITKNITVDLNKHTLCLKWINNDKYMITASGNVSIINGNVDCKTTSTGRTAIKVGENADVLIDDLNVSCYLESDPTQFGIAIGSTANNNKCTINDGIFNGAVSTNGTYTNNTFIINGGTYNTYCYFPAKGKYEINGGTFTTHNEAIFTWKSGDPLTINAGSFNVIVDEDYDAIWGHANSGSMGGNAALVVEACDYNGNGNPTVYIGEDVKFNVTNTSGKAFYDILVMNYGYKDDAANTVDCSNIKRDYAIVNKGDAVDANGQITGHVTSKGEEPSDGWLIIDDSCVTIVHSEV